MRQCQCTFYVIFYHPDFFIGSLQSNIKLVPLCPDWASLALNLNFLFKKKNKNKKLERKKSRNITIIMNRKSKA